MTHPVVRSALFVPASRAERIPKRWPPARTPSSSIWKTPSSIWPRRLPAKRCVIFLGTHRQARLWVRINDASTSWHDDDLKACRGHPGVAEILLPKAESLAQVRHVAQTGLPVIPILKPPAAC